MKISYDFCIFEDIALKYIPQVKRKRQSIFSIVHLDQGSDDLEHIVNIHRKLQSESFLGSLITNYEIKFRYSKAELEKAKLFHMHVGRFGQIAMASNQSVYDWSQTCSRCGAGRKQIKPLEINVRRLPKTRKLVYTIGSEWLIAEPLASAMKNEEFTGLEVRPVVHDGKATSDEVDKLPLISELKRYVSGQELIQKMPNEARMGAHLNYFWLTMGPLKELWRQCVDEHNDWLRSRKYAHAPSPEPWYQLVITSRPIPTCPPTRFGIDPFDDDAAGQHRCPMGHVSGLSLLSEVSIKESDWDGSDIIATSNLVGYRAGYLVPEPIILVSPRLRKFLLAQKARGLIFDVAHVVN